MNFFSRRSGNNGIVLAIVMMTIVLMAFLAVAVLEMGQGQYKQTMAISADRYKARMAAEFGLREAFWRIDNNFYIDIQTNPPTAVGFPDGTWAPYDFYFDIDDFSMNSSPSGPTTISAGDDVKISISTANSDGHRTVTCTGINRNP